MAARKQARKTRGRATVSQAAAQHLVSRGGNQKPMKREPIVREPIAREPIARDVTVVREVRVPESTIDRVIALVRKEHGEGSITRLSDIEPCEAAFPWPFENMAAAIGIPGFPRAKIVQMYGGSSAGKTTIAKCCMAVAQRAGYVVHHWDRENSLDPVRDAKLGVRLEDVLVHDQTLILEEAFDEMDTVITVHRKIKTPLFMVVDSLAAYMTKTDIDRPYDHEAKRAAHAIFFSRSLPKFMSLYKDMDIAILFINQVRTNANASTPWAKTTYPPGGNALAHFCHLTIEQKHLRILKQGSAEHAVPIGVTGRGRIEKSKLSTPFKTYDLNIYADRVEQAQREAFDD